MLEENRVYRALFERHSPHWRLQDGERTALAETGKPLGQLLHDVLTSVSQFHLSEPHGLQPRIEDREGIVVNNLGFGNGQDQGRLTLFSSRTLCGG